MTILQNLKNNLKIEANRRQAILFAKADEIDAQACKAPLESTKRRRLSGEARAIRDEAFAIGDTYYRVMA